VAAIHGENGYEWPPYAHCHLASPVLLVILNS